jgi:APA family basic amino acid/polyamine antiporter
MTQPRPGLQRVLGLAVGLAIAFGGTLGVGILRLPGVVAGAVGSPALALLCWLLGAAYAGLSALALAELATFRPESGGFRVYVRAAFGDGAAFATGWVDVLVVMSSTAYASVAAGDFLGALVPSLAGHGTATGLTLLAALVGTQWIGVRTGGGVTLAVSLGLSLIVLLVSIACLVHGPAGAGAGLPTVVVPPLPHLGWAALMAVVPAMRSIITAYDGWYSPMYLAGEHQDPGRTLPRALLGGVALVAGAYLLVNIALLRVLSVPQLAASTMPVATAALVVLPRGGAMLVTLFSLLVMVNLVNTNLLLTPRVLYSMSNEGWLPARLKVVSSRGTPRAALATCALIVAALVSMGSFEQLVALFAVAATLYYCAAFLAVIVLRVREPDAPRPFRMPLFPLPALVPFVVTVGFLVVSAIDEPRTAIAAALYLAVAVPIYLAARRFRRAG